jgi:hypothetical protein
MSDTTTNPAATRSVLAPRVRADGARRDSVWRGLFFLVVLVLILITVWHAVDRITTRHAEESFATGQIQLRIAKLENRARVAEARARIAAADAARDSAIATAGIGSMHSLAGSASPRVQRILDAISNAIARAGSGAS